MVFNPAGDAIPKARVQVQMMVRGRTVKDITADGRGQFHLRGLPKGEYWLGVSAPGFNLHYWQLTISHSFGEAKIQPALTPGPEAGHGSQQYLSPLD